MREVIYDQAFTYKYSRREQTFAGLHLEDDVAEEVKSRRLAELIDTFQMTTSIRNSLLEVGRLHVVLVEGEGDPQGNTFTGRTDTNKRVIFPNQRVLQSISKEEAKHIAMSSLAYSLSPSSTLTELLESIVQKRREGQPWCNEVKKGDYVIVKITAARGHTLRGLPVAQTSITQSTSLSLPSLLSNA